MSIIAVALRGLAEINPPPWLPVTLRMQTTALRLITTTGCSVDCTRITGQNYDPATGDLVSGLTATWPVPVLQQEYTTREIDGELIQRGDAKFLLPGVAPAPLVDDRLTVGAVTWTVVGVQTVQPAGIPIIHTLQVRR